MNKVKILLMAGIISVGAIGSSIVYAASTSSYSTTVGRVNGTQSSRWVRITNGSTVKIPNQIGANLSTRLHFSNDISTLVNVQVSGRWNPDESNFK